MGEVATAVLKLGRETLAASLALVKVKATSSAVSAEPSEKVTSERIVKVQVNPSGLTVYPVARSFTISLRSLAVISAEWISATPVSPKPSTGSKGGLRVEGSIAITTSWRWLSRCGRGEVEATDWELLAQPCVRPSDAPAARPAAPVIRLRRDHTDAM